MTAMIRVAILDDHQAIVDGYLFRLAKDPEIEIAFTIHYGEELEPMLEKHPVDVLLLDIGVPASAENRNPFPLIYHIPPILDKHSDLSILVMSMYDQISLVNSFLEAGVRGYVLKDDYGAITQLPSLARIIAKDGFYLSPQISRKLMKAGFAGGNQLSSRQIEILSLCAAYPEIDTNELARRSNIAYSTFRNLLSKVFLRLDVHNRVAAVAKARQLGLIAPEVNHTGQDE